MHSTIAVYTCINQKFLIFLAHGYTVTWLQDGGDVSNEDAAKRYKRIDAQLRRLCEKKPSGKLNVPLPIHEMWLRGGKDRDELRLLFEQYELNKDPSTWYVTTYPILIPCMHADIQVYACMQENRSYRAASHGSTVEYAMIGGQQRSFFIIGECGKIKPTDCENEWSLYIFWKASSWFELCMLQAW